MKYFIDKFGPSKALSAESNVSNYDRSLSEWSSMQMLPSVVGISLPKMFVLAEKHAGDYLPEYSSIPLT
jgi:hypothetical protein